MMDNKRVSIGSYYGVTLEQDNEFQTLVQMLIEKILQLLCHFEQQSAQLAPLIAKNIGLLSDQHALLGLLIKSPEPVIQTYIAYSTAVIQLLKDQLKQWESGHIPPIQDKRFQNEAWRNHPLFHLLCQHYLLLHEHAQRLLQQIEYSEPALAKRVKFFTKQCLDAFAPTNFLHTNPQLIAETVESQGKNLLRGFKNLLSDIEVDTVRLNIKMNDSNAFKVGDNLATTPGQVIFQNDLMELIQFTPQTPQVRSIPLLVIPPWINKYYILDLSPHNSMIGWLVKQGITVFSISWINPDARHASKGLVDYMQEGPLAALEIIQNQLQVKQVNTLGFCIGGTLLAMLLAYEHVRQSQTIRSATFLATLIDFSDPGDIAVFIDEDQITFLEKHMHEKGFLEGHIMASTFNSLRASDLIWFFFINNYLRAKPPAPLDTLYWNADSTNMTATMHSQYLRWMYLQNDLVKPNKVQLNGIPLDVSNISIPTFFVGTQRDHIAPWKTTYKGFQLMQGKKRFLLGGSGHVAGIVIPPTSEKYGFYRNVATPKNPDEWLANATRHSGSWWPEWLHWLEEESGKYIQASNIAQLPFQPIMAAPGSYVHRKIS
jgi:polyhydroxyalkanoate synthase